MESDTSVKFMETSVTHVTLMATDHYFDSNATDIALHDVFHPVYIMVYHTKKTLTAGHK